MARLEDFLNEARTEALALHHDLSERDDGRAWQAKAGYAAKEARGRFEDSLNIGFGDVMHGMDAIVRSTPSPLRDETAARAVTAAQRRPATHYDVPSHPRLQRIGQCLATAADLTDRMSAPEWARVHDHAATTAAHAARITSAGLTRPRDQGAAHRLTGLASTLDASRSSHAQHHLGDLGLAGVPTTRLERDLARWTDTSRAQLSAEHLSENAIAAPHVAETAAVISAAAYRAALAQDGPEAQDRAERWKDQARAWQTAAQSWDPPPMIVSGTMHPTPEVVAATHAVRTTINDEFRDTQQRWVPPERLADPAALRRFEHDARRAMTDLAPRYHDAVSSVVASEVLTIPVRQLQRAEGSGGIDPSIRFGSLSWTTLPHTDPAADALSSRAADVERAARSLTHVAQPPETTPAPTLAAAAKLSPTRSETDAPRITREGRLAETEDILAAGPTRRPTPSSGEPMHPTPPEKTPPRRDDPRRETPHHDAPGRRL